MRRAALLLAWALLPLSARAEGLYDIYASGRYAEAIRAGEAAGTAPGYAIAARAVLAEAVQQQEPCMSCFERAEALARRAVAADPRHADGQVWLAVSLGYETRITGPLVSRLHGRPEEAKTAIDAALKADPKNPYALAALGGWNIEIVRLGGSFLARKMFGASEAEGLALFDRAVAAAPGNVAVHYQAALSLAGYDPERLEGRIRARLEAAVAATPATAHERFLHGRAADLLALLKKGDGENFAARVHKYQGYP